MGVRVLDSFRDGAGELHLVELVGRHVILRAPNGEARLLAELSPFEGEAEARGALAEFLRHPRPSRRLAPGEEGRTTSGGGEPEP